MSQNLVIGIILVVIVAVLGIWVVSSSSKTHSSATNTTSPTQDHGTARSQNGTTGAAVPKSSNTFVSIFSQSGSHECIYEQVGDARARNIIRIADGKMRGEFRTVTGPDLSATLMVYDQGYLYTWTEGTSVGKKTQIRTVADLPKAIPEDLTSGAIYGTNLDSVGWDCHTWLKDPTLLVPPSYVKFSAAS